MATVFMKWLEARPRDYDRGITLLTLGSLPRLYHLIALEQVTPGMRVLELGCGTGRLATMMAGQGAVVSCVEASHAMLVQARAKLAKAGLEVDLRQVDVVQVADLFPAGSFDLVVSTLLFSELPEASQQVVLAACRRLLAPGGRLLLADEVIPTGLIRRSIYWTVRVPLAALTWMLTRTSTTPLRAPEGRMREAGLQARSLQRYLGGSLVLYEAVPSGKGYQPPGVVEQLQHHVSARTVLADIWAALFRIVPPYPKVRPGLYGVGKPDEASPVLVTGNYDLTVRRLVRALDGQVDCWMLVADSAGINVWCGAGGGFFSTSKIVSAISSSSVGQLVEHRELILPQLCANGVNRRQLEQESGWRARWGPIRATDIPAYLSAGALANDTMRQVTFPPRDRLEMAMVTLGFYGLILLVPILVFWRHLFWPATLTLVGLSYFYALVHPWLPGGDGLEKSIPMTALALLGLLVFTAAWERVPAPELFNRSLGVGLLAFFVSAEMQGMSPLMRGEQANWGWLVIVGLSVALVYWLVPLAVGWR